MYKFIAVILASMLAFTAATNVKGCATIPYELPQVVADVCSNLVDGAICPISKDEDVVYKFNFYVDTHYPEIPVAVEVSLVDEDDESVACFVCDIKVKNAVN